LDSHEQASSGTGSAPAYGPAARFGRRAGIAIYLAVLLYMVSIGFATFVQGIFLDSAHADGTGTGSCDDIRRELATGLRTRAAAHVGGDTSETTNFLRSFDDRIDALRARCDDTETARLERMRYRVEITLRRFDRENASTFEQLGAGTSSPTHEEPPR